MAIQVIKTPHTISFSKNPVLFFFKLAPFTAIDIQNRLRLVISVEMESETHKGDFEKVYEYIEYPDAGGYIETNIQSVLHAHLQYLTPDFNIIKFHRAKHHVKRFRITYYSLDADNNTTVPVTSSIYYAIKGGLSKEEWHEKNFFTNNIDAQLQPLHFYFGENQSDINIVRMDEVKWMYFLTKGSIYNYLQLRVTITLDDGTTSTYTAIQQQFNAGKYASIAVRVDPTGVKLSDNTPAGKQVVQYSILVRYYASTVGEFVALTPNIQFNIDYRPFYNPVYILYRNSLGALNTQVFTGELQHKIEIEKNKSAVLPLSAMYGHYTIQSEISDTQNFKTDPVEGNSGWINIGQLMSMKDLVLHNEAYRIYGSRLQKIYVNTNSAPLYKKSDFLYNLKIDWQPAYTDDSNSRELAVTQPNTCPAVYYVSFSQQKGGKLHIMWKLLDGYERMQIELVYDGDTYEFEVNGNSGEFDYFITTPNQSPIITKSIQARARTVCNDEVEPYSYGPWSSVVNVNVVSAIAPITIDDVVDVTHRTTVARILQKNGTDFNPLSNDIPVNGSILSVTEFFDSAGAPSTTSINGANLSVIGGNKIEYFPTSASINITDEDKIYYRCREFLPALGGGGIPGNIAVIRVPMNGQIPKVWVKVRQVTQSVTAKKYGLFKGYSLDEIVEDIYLQFFKDQACTIPLDVSTYGIIVPYKRFTEETHWSWVGQPGTTTGPTLLSSGTINAVGFSTLVEPNHHRLVVTPGSGAGDYTTQELFYYEFNSSFAGSAGNYEILS